MLKETQFITNRIKLAVQQGAQAYVDFADFHSNPYSQVTEIEMYHAWAAGWRDEKNYGGMT